MITITKDNEVETFNGKQVRCLTDGRWLYESGEEACSYGEIRESTKIIMFDRKKSKVLTAVKRDNECLFDVFNNEGFIGVMNLEQVTSYELLRYKEPMWFGYQDEYDEFDVWADYWKS